MTAAADQRAGWLALASAATAESYLSAGLVERTLAAAVPALIAEVEALEAIAALAGDVAGWSQFRCSPLCHAVIEHEECTCGMVRFNAALDALRAALTPPVVP